jgi:hypothetical protein
MSKKIPSAANHGIGNVLARSACYLQPRRGAAMQFLMRQGFGSSRARALGCGHWKSALCCSMLASS